ncbi:MAG: DUF169 domain-containing protein [Bacteroidales bacterium]|nr:DUF169 domain-containing protein [Bacteroidales bacterium]
MDIAFKEKFTRLWTRFFGNAELPVVFFYSDNEVKAEIVEPAQKWNCFIGELAKVRKGKSLAYDQEAVSCGGGKKYLGFTDMLRPGFEYFLSCGNDKIEGERYLQSPELVEKFLSNAPWTPAKGKRIVFKRWDMLLEDDNPEVAIFFASPDVLSGLFTLAGFDREDMNGTIAPFGSGCSSVIQYPLAESLKEKPRAVLGMLDVSARPFVHENVMSFALPVKRLEEITGFMEETFLITGSWEKVKKRINARKDV